MAYGSTVGRPYRSPTAFISLFNLSFGNSTSFEGNPNSNTSERNSVLQCSAGSLTRDEDTGPGQKSCLKQGVFHAQANCPMDLPLAARWPSTGFIVLFDLSFSHLKLLEGKPTSDLSGEGLTICSYQCLMSDVCDFCGDGRAEPLI